MTRRLQWILAGTLAVPVRVEAADQAGRQFRIRPGRPLAANQVYRFRLELAGADARPHQWAFQTRAAFRILGSLPRNQGTGVPVNTGIEIYFSHEEFGDPEPYVRITPAVAGRFERHKRTLVFVPVRPLAPGTIYTVTVGRGLPLTGTGEALAADFTFAFETAEPNAGAARSGLNLIGGEQQFPAAEAPFFQFGFGNTGLLPTIDTVVYRYPGAAAYTNALRRLESVPDWAPYNRSTYRAETAGLAEVARFKLQTHRDPGGYMAYLLFPEPLPPGYYLAEFSAFGQMRQRLFQVTDLAAYASVTETETLVWVNDLSTGAPPPPPSSPPRAGGRRRRPTRPAWRSCPPPGVSAPMRTVRPGRSSSACPPARKRRC